MSDDTLLDINKAVHFKFDQICFFSRNHKFDTVLNLRQKAGFS